MSTDDRRERPEHLAPAIDPDHDGAARDGPDDRPAAARDRVLERVEGHHLPATLEDLADEYEVQVGQRDRFLWKWIHALLPHVSLSTVPPEYAEAARDAKTAASMFVVLLDDLGERDQDVATLTEASKIPFEGRTPDPEKPGVDGETVAVAQRLWDGFDELLDGPRREEFAEVLAFDLDRTVTAVEHSYLLNRNLEMATLEETWRYDCDNMMLFPYADVDLAYSPPFRRRDLGSLRLGIRRAQRLARIGNWITTWEREVSEGDFSSGIVVDAMARGVVSPGELYALRADATEADAESVVDRVKRAGVEERFLRQWEDDHRAARAFVDEIESVDFGAYLEGMETVLEFHLASRGLK